MGTDKVPHAAARGTLLIWDDGAAEERRRLDSELERFRPHGAPAMLPGYYPLPSPEA
jgi:hypothetical protein